ncbi:MAG TPA: TIGR04222 domain-containing membrane protein [Micromonosporaceae bacterium]|nr:TIGR04222 domain-containing membrane protein [Micromonosporaceae bacterium]
MTLFGAAGDTWGVPGRSFALLYLLGAIVVVTGVVLWRRAVAAGPVERPEPLTPPEWAYLAGGPPRAAAAALAALHGTDSVRTGPGGRLEVTGRLPRVTRELDRAVYSAAGRGVTRRALADDPTVSAALERVRAGLVRDGWLLDEATRRRVRLASLPVLGLVLVGVAALVAGVQGGFLIVELSAAVVAQLLLLRAPRTSRAARRLLDGQRRSSWAGRPRAGSYSSAVPGATAGAAFGAAAGGIWGEGVGDSGGDGGDGGSSG